MESRLLTDEHKASTGQLLSLDRQRFGR